MTRLISLNRYKGSTDRLCERLIACDRHGHESIHALSMFFLGLLHLVLVFVKKILMFIFLFLLYYYLLNVFSFSVCVCVSFSRAKRRIKITTNSRQAINLKFFKDVYIRWLSMLSLRSDMISVKIYGKFVNMICFIQNKTKTLNF